MAFELTYDSLKTTVTSYLQDKSEAVTDQLPTFIMLAQRRIAKDCKTLGMEFLDTSNLTVGDAFFLKPPDWRNTISFVINPASNPALSQQSFAQQLILRPVEYLTQYNSTGALGLPIYYAEGSFRDWLLAPIPDFAYTVAIQYMCLPPLIDEFLSTNWMTQYAPECLIYATLYETASFLMDDPRMQTWYQLYSQAMSALNNEDASRKQDRFINIKAD